MLSRGDVFAARYRVERCIGSGGMGAVFEAEHLETERKVALKVLLPQSLLSEGARERFKQEARVAGRLRHANVVDVIDAGVDDVTSMPYLVMELLHGEDLGTRVERLGPLSPAETVAVLRQVASALDCLHERSIVHRDLKPENIFLTWADDGSLIVKLLDFGVAKVITEGKSFAFTQDAQGTPVYMAPEQFAEQIRISPATDIYALGMLAFTLLTGNHYWGPEIQRGMNVFMLARVAEGGPREPATLRADRNGTPIASEFDPWFAIVTALVPGERYPTATDAIDALADALAVIEPIPPSRARFSRARITSPSLAEPPSSRRPALLRELRAAHEDEAPPQSDARQSLSRDAVPPPSGRAARAQSPETPALLLHRARSLWKRPTVMTALLAAVAALLVIANLFIPAPPSSSGSGAAPSSSSGSAPSSRSPSPSSSRLAAPPPSPPPPAVVPAPSQSASSTLGAAEPPRGPTPQTPSTAEPAAIAKPRVVVTSAPRQPVTAAPAISVKRPKYTRD